MRKKKSRKRLAESQRGAPKAIPKVRSGYPKALAPEPEAAVSRTAQPVEERRWLAGGTFPVVGIGASAGGLEALDQFFARVPAKSGVAYVVIQHLDPTQKGMLVELLQRGAAIPIVQAKDRLKVEADHVYVIPPNKDMSILHGTLHLFPQTSPRGLNLPIDFFLRSLADDQQERSIGVILSGMGSDGTLGLRAIKEKAGVAFVQAIGSAKFDGMPRSAIEAGLADVVCPIEELPEKVLAYTRRARHHRSDVLLEGKAQSALEKVAVLLRAQTGNDFSLYKKSTIHRRVERRMGLHQIDNIAHYVRYLRENPREIDLLFKELLIGVTSFFRDPAAWDALKSEVVPALLATRTARGPLRAWVPACSTGEEAYSLAVVLKEALESFSTARNVGLQIFATDLDGEAIERARLGLYPTNIAADISPERLRRFFVQEEHGYRVGKEIRELVVFAPQNLIMDPPFTKLDVLSCRNLLIYLSADLQRKLVPLFHYSLNPGSILLLGSAETIGSFTTLFAPIDAKTRLYRRLEPSVAGTAFEFPSSTPGARRRQDDLEVVPSVPAKTLPNLQTLADRVLVEHFGPLGVLCTDKGDILYISGRAGRYLEPAVGKANLNLFAMAREGLRYQLTRAFTAALREDRIVTVRGIKVGTNGGSQHLDLSIQRLTAPSELRGTVMVVMSDVPGGAPSASPARARGASRTLRVAELEQELRRSQEEVQTSRAEMQTSQEELKSTNEELQSSNEEIQSSNEELTTSKEEMQSLNEELQTLNHELQAKVDELSRSNSDMKNLLNSTDIATLFLDDELNVRRFTTQTTRIFKLLPGDAGRPITDIASSLDYPDLAADAREVLRTLIFKQTQVAARDQRWFAVRIMPYRTLDNVIDGVVVTFTDTTAARGLEAAALEKADELRQMAESLSSLMLGFRAAGYCDYVSRQWLEYTGVSEAESAGQAWIDQLHPDDRERVQEKWRAALRSGAGLALELRVRGVGGAYRWYRSRIVPIHDGEAIVRRWYGSYIDIEDLKRALEARARAADNLAALLDSIDHGFIALDRDLVITFLNTAAERLLERERRDVLGAKLFDAFPQGRGSVFQERLNEALRTETPEVFEARFDALPQDRYRVRLQPQGGQEGISVFFERTGVEGGPSS